MTLRRPQIICPVLAGALCIFGAVWAQQVETPSGTPELTLIADPETVEMNEDTDLKATVSDSREGVTVTFCTDDFDIGEAQTDGDGDADIIFLPPRPGVFTVHATADDYAGDSTTVTVSETSPTPTPPRSTPTPTPVDTPPSSTPTPSPTPTPTPGCEKITTETVATAPPDRTRRTIGVGEQVTLTVSAVGGAYWSVSGGGATYPLSGRSTVFTARGPGTSTVTAAIYNGNSCTATFTVIAPSHETAVKSGPDYTFPQGSQGAGMNLRITVHPTTVSFRNIEIREVPGPATRIWGYFTQFREYDLAHRPVGWASILPGNVESADDQCELSNAPKPWSDGGFEWQIPIEWRFTSSTQADGTLPNRVQTFTLQSDGTTTISKLGQTVTRSP